MIESKLQMSYVKVMYEPGNSVTVIEADRRRLTQVISNLLNNAIKFTKEGTVTVTTTVKRKDSMDDAGGDRNCCSCKGYWYMA